MKTFFKIALGTAIIAAVILIIRNRHDDLDHQLNQVSDEGYETAPDILFPNQKIKTDKRLHYGPVLPS